MAQQDHDPQTCRDVILAGMELAALNIQTGLGTWTPGWQQFNLAVCRELSLPMSEPVGVGDLLTAIESAPDDATLRLYALLQLYTVMDARQLTEQERHHYFSMLPPEVHDDVEQRIVEAEQRIEENKKLREAHNAKIALIQDWLYSRIDLPEDIISWLDKQCPDTWHEVVLGRTYDGDIEEIRWIAEQPQCDKATIATIYCAGAREYIRQPESEHYKLMKLISDNWRAGFYTRSELQFDTERHSIPFFDESDPWGIPNEELLELAQKQGRESKSPFASNDGEIRYNFEIWKRMQGL